MPSVFISYRRSDAVDVARRMASELKTYFGADAIFFDQTTALPGAKWPDSIRAALDEAQVMLVVIGPTWFDARDEQSRRRRIDLAEDWVRQEILTALQRQRNGEPLEVIPVLVSDASMPDPGHLDEELGELCEWQGIRVVSSGTTHDFDELKEQLVRLRIEPRVLPPVATPRFRRLPQRLTQDEEQAFLAKWSEWEIVETAEPHAPGGVMRELHRVYEFTTFEDAFRFMTEVVRRAIEPYSHHPRWQNAYFRVEVWLTTFNLNYRPSNRDVRLAEMFEEIWREFTSKPKEAPPPSA